MRCAFAFLISVPVAPQPTLEPVTLARAALSAGIVRAGQASPTPPRRPPVFSRAHVCLASLCALCLFVQVSAEEPCLFAFAPALLGAPAAHAP